MRPADVAAANRQRRPHVHTAAAIEHLHEAIRHEPHPDHKAKITAALNSLMQMQAQMLGEERAAPNGR